MALIIILSKAVVKQLAYEQTIREQTLAGILMKTRVGSTSIPVSLNPSNSMLRSGVLGSHSGNMHAECVCEGSKTCMHPTPHLQNNQKSPRQIWQI